MLFDAYFSVKKVTGDFTVYMTPKDFIFQANCTHMQSFHLYTHTYIQGTLNITFKVDPIFISFNQDTDIIYSLCIYKIFLSFKFTFTQIYSNDNSNENTNIIFFYIYNNHFNLPSMHLCHKIENVRHVHNF